MESGPVDEAARQRTLARLRRGAGAEVLATLAQRPGALVSVSYLARVTLYSSTTVRDLLQLAKSVGLVYSHPIPGSYPAVTGWATPDPQADSPKGTTS